MSTLSYRERLRSHLIGLARSAGIRVPTNHYDQAALLAGTSMASKEFFEALSVISNVNPMG